jgi:hypothetical protein
MKNWWLKLYTIPSLLVLGKAFFLVVSLILLARSFAPEFLIYLVWGTVYIGKTILLDARKSLATNIEFHKLHIPYPELRKILISDNLIRMGASSAALGTCLVLSYTPNMDFDTSFSFIGAAFISLVMVSQVGSVNSVINGKRRFSVYNMDHLHLISRICLNSITWFVAILFVSIMMFFEFNPVFIILFSTVGIFSFSNAFNYKALFHQEKETGSYKTMVKYYLKGVGAGMAVFLLGIAVMRPMINIHRLSPFTKYVAYEYVGPFTPELDIETTKDLLSWSDVNEGPILRDSPGIEQVPISELYPKPTMKNYLTYLENVDNPSEANLKYLLEKNQLYKGDPKLKLHLSAKVTQRWPKNKKFPEEFLNKKIVREERLPASTNVEPQK